MGSQEKSYINVEIKLKYAEEDNCLNKVLKVSPKGQSSSLKTYEKVL